MERLLCSESRGWNGRGLSVVLGIWRVERFREGDFVCGGRCCYAFFLVASVCLTLSLSGDRIVLRVWWGRLDFAGCGGIGRVELSVEGGTVACVLNREGGIVGNGRLGWGFGGWNGWVVD